MATLRLRLFGTPRDELAATVDGEVPDWIERVYRMYGVTSENAPASASVEALGESLHFRLKALSRCLRKMEGLGWWIEPREWDLLAHTELDEIAAQAELEKEGIWVIAREHALQDEQGNVRWGHGLFSKH
jgi:hypothetical protein